MVTVSGARMVSNWFLATIAFNQPHCVFHWGHLIVSIGALSQSRGSGLTCWGSGCFWEWTNILVGVEEVGKTLRGIFSVVRAPVFMWLLMMEGRLLQTCCREWACVSVLGLTPINFTFYTEMETQLLGCMDSLLVIHGNAAGMGRHMCAMRSFSQMLFAFVPRFWEAWQGAGWETDL